LHASMPDVQGFVDRYVAEMATHLRNVSALQVIAASERLLEAYRAGAQVLIAGNGGSASTASHFACDLGKTVLGANPTLRSSRFRVVSLADNVALLTAWANDEGYDTVFAEQVKALGRAADVLVVISVSGNSLNILAALRAARERRMETIGLLGCDGGEAKELIDHPIIVPCDDYGHVESAHLVLAHLLTQWFTLHVAAEQPAIAG
jgi:D-sedoheptulose 7-phosphate isomerase